MNIQLQDTEVSIIFVIFTLSCLLPHMKYSVYKNIEFVERGEGTTVLIE